MKFNVRGAGPVILFLHGIPANGRLWDRVVLFFEKKFTCVVVDLPALGESPPLADGSLDPTRYAEEIDALREQLEIPRWHVVGHDAGATVAVHYAARFGRRVNKLVLCSAPVFPEFRVPWFFRLARTALIGDWLAMLVTGILLPIALRREIGGCGDAKAEIIRSFRRPFTGFAGAKRFARLVCWGDPAQVLAKTAALLPAIGAPALILHGRTDGAIPMSFATRAAAAIPCASLHLLDCGHFVPLNAPEEFSARVLSFFETPS